MLTNNIHMVLCGNSALKIAILISTMCVQSTACVLFVFVCLVRTGLCLVKEGVMLVWYGHIYFTTSSRSYFFAYHLRVCTDHTTGSSHSLWMLLWTWSNTNRWVMTFVFIDRFSSLVLFGQQTTLPDSVHCVVGVGELILTIRRTLKYCATFVLGPL